MRQFGYAMFISNNRASFHLRENKIWSNIKKSQSIMNMIVDTDLPPSKQQPSNFFVSPDTEKLNALYYKP